MGFRFRGGDHIGPLVGGGGALLRHNGRDYSCLERVAGDGGYFRAESPGQLLLESARGPVVGTLLSNRTGRCDQWFSVCTVMGPASLYSTFSVVGSCSRLAPGHAPAAFVPLLHGSSQQPGIFIRMLAGGSSGLPWKPVSGASNQSLSICGGRGEQNGALPVFERSLPLWPNHL